MINKKYVALDKVVEELDSFFNIEDLEKDPAMSHFVSQVYKDSEHELKYFKKTFLKRYNGLMIEGDKNINRVFTASFPHDEILSKFISESIRGDLLFLHHPIPLESGNSKGKLGRGFIKNNPSLIQKILKKKLSIYVCHAPLDYHGKISTGRAISEALNARIKKTFLSYGNGDAGLIVEIEPISTAALTKKLKKIFRVSSIDVVGKTKDPIRTVSIVAGGGDEVEYSQIAKKMGAQAYITGEIFSHQKNEWAMQNTKKMKEYVKTIDICLIGVSHAASESLVMRTQIPKWFKNRFNLPTTPISQTEWWL